ncbi:MAG: hypothetical protein AB1758_30525, partial [Candidatus Eremiobacterota bacterium]
DEPAALAREGGSSLFQQATHQDDHLLVDTVERLEGTTEPYVAYRPDSLLGRGRHDGVTANAFFGLAEGSHRFAYRWSFPDLGQNIAVTVGHPVDPDVPPALDDVMTTTAGQSEILLEILAEVAVQGELFLVTGQILLDGQPAADLNYTYPVVRNDSGVIINAALLGVTPVFEHPASGEFRLVLERDGQTLIDERYLQRGLVWEQPWPDFENHPMDTPITIENRLAWDLGPAMDDGADAPRWRAVAAGAEYPPRAFNGVPQYAPGRDVHFTFDPENVLISPRTGDGRPGSVTLRPEMGFEYASREAFREDVRARECQTVFGYSVEGRAISYDAPPPVLASSSFFRDEDSGGLIPARIRQLFADNARFDPSVLQRNQGTVFKADVLSCLFEDPQIRWTFVVTGERPIDPEDPDTDFETFTAFATDSGDWSDFTEGYVLEIPWDGRDPEGNLAAPGTYQANLNVEVRERTRVDRNGNEILLATSAGASLEILGQQEVRITTFTADPAEFDPVTVERVLFNAGTEISGFTETPIYDWSFRILNPDGSDLLSLDSPGGGPGFGFEWNGRNGDNILASGTYTAEVTVVARSPSDPTVRPSDTKTLSIQVGEGSELAGVLELEDDETGELLGTSEVQPAPYDPQDPIASLGPIAGPTLNLGRSNDAILLKPRNQSKVMTIRYFAPPPRKVPMEVLVKLSHSDPQGVKIRLDVANETSSSILYRAQVTFAGTTDAAQRQIGVKSPAANSYTTVDGSSGEVNPGDPDVDPPVPPGDPEIHYECGNAQDGIVWEGLNPGATRMGFAA